jgi:hypothetical protein
MCRTVALARWSCVCWRAGLYQMCVFGRSRWSSDVGDGLFLLRVLVHFTFCRHLELSAVSVLQMEIGPAR